MKSHCFKKGMAALENLSKPLASGIALVGGALFAFGPAHWKQLFFFDF